MRSMQKVVFACLLIASAAQPTYAQGSAHWWGNEPGSATGRDDKCAREAESGTVRYVPCWHLTIDKQNMRNNTNGNGFHNVKANNDKTDDDCDYDPISCL